MISFTFREGIPICNYRFICMVICFMSISQLNYKLRKGGNWVFFFFFSTLYPVPGKMPDIRISLLNERMSLQTDEEDWPKHEVGGVPCQTLCSPFCWELNHSMNKCTDWMSWVEFFYGIVLFHVLTSESKGFSRIVSSLWWVSGASRNSLQNKIIKQFIVQYIWKGPCFTSWLYWLSSSWFGTSLVAWLKLQFLYLYTWTGRTVVHVLLSFHQVSTHHPLRAVAGT